jgi:hypothetical protein
MVAGEGEAPRDNHRFHRSVQTSLYPQGFIVARNHSFVFRNTFIFLQRLPGLRDADTFIILFFNRLQRFKCLLKLGKLDKLGIRFLPYAFSYPFIILRQLPADKIKKNISVGGNTLQINPFMVGVMPCANRFGNDHRDLYRVKKRASEAPSLR